MVHSVKFFFKINKYTNTIFLLSLSFEISSINSNTAYDVDILAQIPYWFELKMSFAFKKLSVLARNNFICWKLQQERNWSILSKVGFWSIFIQRYHFSNLIRVGNIPVLNKIYITNMREKFCNIYLQSLRICFLHIVTLLTNSSSTACFGNYFHGYLINKTQNYCHPCYWCSLQSYNQCL